MPGPPTLTGFQDQRPPWSTLTNLVPIEGIDPSLPKEHGFEPCASAFRHIGLTLVALLGLQPRCLAALAPKASVSSNSTIGPQINFGARLQN